MTLMKQETMECPLVADQFLKNVYPLAHAEGQLICAGSYDHLQVLGRGSSSHAGTILRYGASGLSNLLVSAAMPSISSTQGAGTSNAKRSVVIAISQSGKSPDLIQYVSQARIRGSRVCSLVNTPSSALARNSDLEIELHAGPENAVAATKSTFAAGLACLGLLSGIEHQIKGENALFKDFSAIPEMTQKSLSLDWSALTALLPKSRAVFFIGRGATLGIAKELALKVTETTGIPAIAYSSAEFLHGPIGAVDATTPVIAMSSDKSYHSSIQTCLSQTRDRKAPTLLSQTFGASDLDTVHCYEAFTDALLMLPPAYLAIEAAATHMGRNPDTPVGLNKVTETI